MSDVCLQGIMQERRPRFSPALPEKWEEVLNRKGVGLLNKVVLSYDRKWWMDSTSGDWFYLLPSDFASKSQTATCLDVMPNTEEQARTVFRTIGVALRDYSYGMGHPTLVAFIPPPAAQALEMLPSEWIVESLHHRLVRSLAPSHQQGDVPAPAQAKVTRWGKDPFSLGAYSYIPSSSESEPLDFSEMREPLWNGRLGFCGEHTDSKQLSDCLSACIQLLEHYTDS